MEQRDRTAVATFFASEPMVGGHVTTLSEGEAHHARVRRIAIGDRLRLVDGAGGVGYGNVVKLGKAQAMVEVDVLDRVEPLPVIHLMVPIADRDRMLLVGEKATELSAFSWRPVMWRRSRDVSPRGEGMSFQTRLRARMVGALTQCGGAWLPVIYPDAPPDRCRGIRRTERPRLERRTARWPHARRARAGCSTRTESRFQRCPFMRRSRWRSDRRADSSRGSARS